MPKTFKLYYITAYFGDNIPEDAVPNVTHDTYALFGQWIYDRQKAIEFAGGMKMKYNLPDEGKFAVKIFEAVLKPIEVRI